MKRTNFLVFLFLLLAAASGFSQRHQTRRATRGEPGVFDYYVLSLSWSPEFCYSHPGKPECQSGHHGFVVHGLWPQFADGYPENCSNAPGLAHPQEMADIMPDWWITSGARMAPAAGWMRKATSNFSGARSPRSKYRKGLPLRGRISRFRHKM